MRRTVYITAGARHLMPELTMTLQSVIEAYAGSLWRLRATEPLSTELAAHCLVLATEEETAADAEWAQSRHALTYDEFISFVQTFGLRMSSSGLCGR